MICQNSKLYTLVNVYVHNSHQIRFIKKLIKTVQSLQKGSISFGGNFNAVTDHILDTSFTSKGSCPELKTLLHASKLYDVWRCHYGNENDYAFFSPRHTSYSRIDLFLVDKWVLQQTSSSSIYDITWSDHASISFTMEEKDDCPRTFVWRCNNSIIQHPANLELPPGIFLCQQNLKFPHFHSMKCPQGIHQRAYYTTWQ